MPSSEPDTGLSAAQAAQRLAEDGPNALPAGQHRSLLSIAAETVREPMFLLLLAAGTLYLVFGDLQEGLTLFGFVVVTVALTLYQEGKTERAIEALRDLTSPRALVIRDGKPQRIAGRDVVRGDLLKLSEGDRIAADALLVSADGVRADESLLTGEAVPVGKRVAQPDELARAANPSETARVPPGGDDLPAVYAGTLIVQGTCAGARDSHRRAQRDRPHRHGAGHGGKRALAVCRSRPPCWCATWPCWRWRSAWCWCWCTD
jgi:Ca2+-transporting ATPase